MTTPTGALHGYRLRTGSLHIGWIQPDFIHDLPLAADDTDDLEATAERLYELATVRTRQVSGTSAADAAASPFG